VGVMNADNYSVRRIDARKLAFQPLIIRNAPRSNQIVSARGQIRFSARRQCTGSNPVFGFLRRVKSGFRFLSPT